MAGALRKTMVYLGLAEDESVYDEYYRLRRRREQPAPPGAARPGTGAAGAEAAVGCR